MNVRMRSWVGAGAVGLGVVLMVACLLSARAVEIVVDGVVRKVPVYPAGLLYGGIALAAAGVGMILWALSGALRQIRESGEKFDARLRAETESSREQKRPS